MEMAAGTDDIPMRKPTKDERTVLQKIFSEFDENGDNRISSGEMQRALRKVARTGQFKGNQMSKKAKEIIEDVDSDSDGYVSYKEYERVMMRSICVAEHQEKMFRDTFNMFDLDGNGEISRSELIKILRSSKEENPEEYADELLKEADRNGDGSISYKEFVRVFFNEKV